MKRIAPYLKKIPPFQLPEPDICVKCGKDMPAGTAVTWLREPERKGYYHVNEEALPTIENLTRVQVADKTSRLGFTWMRVRDIPTLRDYQENTITQVKTDPEAVAVEHSVGTAKAAPQISADGILLNALADVLLPRLSAQIAEALKNNQPRIIVNVYVPKAGDEATALELLTKELFTLKERTA